jgi:ribosomal protein S12 methylthiotransferase
LKSFSIITLGCPKNQADSEVISGVCTKAGLRKCHSPDNADLVVLNTCAFIAPAVEESLEKLNEVLNWKAAGENRRVVLAGCLPGRYADDGTEGLEEIDLIIGPGEERKLDLWLGGSGEVGGPLGTGVYRYVKIAEGCGNRCNYCTIPMIRGGFVPRSTDDVMESVNQVIRQGAREVGLVAQDTGAHPDLTDILQRVTGLHPEVWFRLYYVHPAHFPPGLPGLIRDRHNLVPYVDLPIQHASPGILDRMGRGYGPDNISRIMESLENLARPVAVRFTVITGYPGETDEDFHSLMSFISRWPSVRHIAAFPWWPEEGTVEFERAKTAGDTVPEYKAGERLAALSSLGEAIYHSWSRRLELSEFPVMADTETMGHSCYDAPEADLQSNFTVPAVPGRIYRCALRNVAIDGMVVEPLP